MFEKELKVEQQIDLPIEQVFDFFSRAENLQRITPRLAGAQTDRAQRYPENFRVPLKRGSEIA